MSDLPNTPTIDESSPLGDGIGDNDALESAVEEQMALEPDVESPDVVAADDEPVAAGSDDGADGAAAAMDEPADEAVADEAVAEQSDADEAAPSDTADDASAADDAPAADDASAVDVEAVTQLVAEAEAGDVPVVDDPWKRPGKWYVVHTQSGYEKKAKANLEARISSMNMEDGIHECVIPLEDVVEFKNGKKVVVQKKMFPGYLLVRCRLDDDSWYVIRNTPNITGFVGQGAKPTPLPRREVQKFLQVQTPESVEAQTKRSKPRLEYELNETVRVKEGPFADFSGSIIEINEDQLKVKVLVNIFGRETPVELDFSQVAKL